MEVACPSYFCLCSSLDDKFPSFAKIPAIIIKIIDDDFSRRSTDRWNLSKYYIIKPKLVTFC